MRSPPRSRARRLAETIAGYLAATYLTLVIFLALYGAIVPWPADRAALRQAVGAQAVVFTGMRTASRQSPDGLHVQNDRYYMAVPDAFRHGRFWRVTERDGGAPQAEPAPAAFWTVAALFVLSLVGTWRYWLRSSRAAAPRAAPSAASGGDAPPAG